jgi:hypothetical protein
MESFNFTYNRNHRKKEKRNWIPAFAGMTRGPLAGMTKKSINKNIPCESQKNSS